jgi:hypothetical protein
MPMPPNFREFSQSSAFAARTSKVDSNGRALLKFDMKLAHFLRIHYNGKAAKMRHPQSLAFAASLQTHI